MLYPILITAADDHSVTIVHIDRSIRSAGRFGQRVKEVWQVKFSGGSARIEFAPYDTRMANTPAPFQQGDHAVVTRSLKDGATMHLTMSDVKH